MEQHFKGRTALVTGAGSGIGKAVSVRLVELGAKVVAVGQTQSKLDKLRDQLGDQVTTISVNLANWDDTDAKLGELCKEVDFLVNNAGTAYCRSVEQITKNDCDSTFDTNLKAPINLIRLVASGMKKRKFGAIVNVSSVAGIVALDEHITYAASKAALDMVTKTCAKELGPYNVRVNSINPTVVWTDLARTHWEDPTKKAEMTAKIPMNRFVEVNEVVEPILFLLSNNSSMINGILMPVDGGFVAT